MSYVRAFFLPFCRATGRVIMGQDDDLARRKRAHIRAVAMRESYAARIRAIHLLVNDDGVVWLLSWSLDDLWSGFQVEDTAVFEALLDLDMVADFTTDLCIEISGLVDYTKAIILHYSEQPAPQSASVVGDDNRASVRSLEVSNSDDVSASRIFSRLPEIPLPQFDGDIHKWPAFRDRFDALVSQRPNIPNIERFYYLIGCLHGVAADVISGIPVSGTTFDLAWSALTSRFD